MCGICGYVGMEDRELIVAMTDALHHRGPDDFGYHHDGDVHLGHRRLSIIDLAGGKQPMSTPDGALTIVYNGEIYNFREIRDRLAGAGVAFDTCSDTEVLLRLYEREGPAALDSLNGMFAFAVFDRRDRSLFLARDRIGIKPLCFIQLPGRFLFASETKSLLEYRGWSPQIDPASVNNYLAFRYVPGDVAMLTDVKRLPAGHYMTVRNGQLNIRQYWSPPAYQGHRPKSDQEYEEQTAHLLEASVRRRLISDVSFGAYLSGGLDSSTIVALMSQMVSSPVKTFSVGFDYEHDELSQAAFLAKHLGCDHHEIACRAEDVELLPQIVYHMDEPMGDAITIPMFQLSREAKKHVTVILTGEGGDEIFGGYLFHKVLWAGEMYRRMAPRVLRDWMITPALRMLPAGVLNTAFKYPAYLGQRGKLKALDYLGLLDPNRLHHAYEHLISLFDLREKSTLYTDDFNERLNGSYWYDAKWAKMPRDRSAPFLDHVLRLGYEHWLPDNMLLRADKVGMAHSVEARVPFLDHELVEFAAQLPPHLKLRKLVGKYILRRVASKLMPQEVTKRKKMPFYVPIENYFQQPAFQELMDELLSEASVRSRGIFRPEAVTRLRTMMHQREFLLVKQVFSLMVLELWFRIFVDRSWKVEPARGLLTSGT